MFVKQVGSQEGDKCDQMSSDADQQWKAAGHAALLWLHCYNKSIILSQYWTMDRSTETGEQIAKCRLHYCVAISNSYKYLHQVSTRAVTAVSSPPPWGTANTMIQSHYSQHQTRRWQCQITHTTSITAMCAQACNTTHISCVSIMLRKHYWDGTTKCVNYISVLDAVCGCVLTFTISRSSSASWSSEQLPADALTVVISHTLLSTTHLSY